MSSNSTLAATAESIKEQSGEIPCLVCAEEGESNSYKSLPRHLVTHDIDIEEYRERYGDVPVMSDAQRRGGSPSVLEKNIGSFDDDLVPRDEIEIEDSDESITCRICGENYQHLSLHVRRHGMTSGIYQFLWPEAPFTSMEGRRQKSVGEYDWEKLDVPRGTLLKHAEWLESIEDTWLLESEMVFNKAVANFSLLTNYSNFRCALAASLFVAAKELVPSIGPDQMAELVDVDRKRMWTYVKRSELRGSAPPANQLHDKVEVMCSCLNRDIEAELMEEIEKIPEHVRYSKRPSALVAAVTYEYLDSLTQEQAAEYMDVTPPGLRYCRDSIEEAKQTA